MRVTIRIVDKGTWFSYDVETHDPLLAKREAMRRYTLDAIAEQKSKSVRGRLHAGRAKGLLLQLNPELKLIPSDRIADVVVYDEKRRDLYLGVDLGTDSRTVRYAQLEDGSWMPLSKEKP